MLTFKKLGFRWLLLVLALSWVSSPLAMAQTEPADRYAKSSLPVVYLSQNWSSSESLEFYSLRQGSPLMHREIFDCLEPVSGAGLFRDAENMTKYGFLSQRPHALNPEGYPIGFVAESAIEMNCSACHTSRFTFGGKEYRVDGSQAMTDVESFLRDLAQAMQDTFKFKL